MGSFEATFYVNLPADLNQRTSLLVHKPLLRVPLGIGLSKERCKVICRRTNIKHYTKYS